MERLDEIREQTEIFFSRHWQADVLGTKPRWEDPFPLASQGPYPNSKRQGCYALFAGSDLWYVGVGASRGSGRYKGEGIGSRIMHVVQVDWTNSSTANRIYRARDTWNGVTHISTIGFPSGAGYLAGSLEQFLLWKLEPSPSRNTCRPGSV